MTGSQADRIKDLRALAQSIVSNVDAVVAKLEANSLPLPSLGADAPSPDFIPLGDTRLQALRRNIVGDARLLAATFTGPRQLVPVDGSISYADLALETGLDEARLTRIIRFLITMHFFVEPELGRVAHSAATKLLATEQMSMDFLGHNYDDTLLGCFYQLESFRKSPHGQSSTDCGMSLALSDGRQTLFEVLENDPPRMTRFNGAMQFVNARGAHSSVEADLLINFDWRGVGDIKLVDIGGSRGHTSLYILKHAPNVRQVVVQDLASVIEEAKKQELPAELALRLSFETASFFDPQPIKDADIYLTRLVFHDWTDEKSLQILRNLVPSMKFGSRLIVNDYILHDNIADADHIWVAKNSRRTDLQMMVALNAKERSVEDRKKLASEGSQNKLAFESLKGTVSVFRKIE